MSEVVRAKADSGQTSGFGGRPAFFAIAMAAAIGFVYVFAYRKTFDWSFAVFHAIEPYRVCFKLFWAPVIVFAVERNFQKLGLRWPYRHTLILTALVPFLFIVVGYQAIGYYLGWRAFQLFHSFLVAVPEELVCNGCILSRVRPLGLVIAAGVTATINMLFHFPQFWTGHFHLPDLVAAAGVFAVAIFLTGTRLYSGSLVPGILIHTLLDYMFNFYPVVRWQNYWDTEYTRGSVLWSGGAEMLFLLSGIFLILASAKRERPA